MAPSPNEQGHLPGLDRGVERGVGASNAHLPVRRWSHITFSMSSRDRIMRFYVDGQLDAAVESPSPAVANVGPLYVGKDLSGRASGAFITSVQMHPFALDDEDVQQAAAVALRDAPDFDGEAERDAELAREADAVVERRAADAFEANLAAFEPPNRNRTRPGSAGERWNG